MSQETYDMQGEKKLICINIMNYDNLPYRQGAQADENLLIDTFKDSVKSKIILMPEGKSILDLTGWGSISHLIEPSTD